MQFRDQGEAITYVFRSMRRVKDFQRGPDELARDITPTRRLLSAVGLPAPAITREYVVITGSKGKGSTAAISAKLLQHLGHKTGLVTSPHLVSFFERIRVDGKMIPEADFIRILEDLSPEIDRIEAGFTGAQYFSPQGIFLAIALKWFDEQGVTAAVMEVGRGGRFDDIAVVPNKLSLFTPILLEHVVQLGRTLDRIAWHKAGIIKRQSFAFSVPQAQEVLEILQAEADALDAEFSWIAPMDMGEYVGRTNHGILMRLGRYGIMELSQFGRYDIENATLAIQGVGNMHSRLPGISHASEEYVEAIRAGMRDVQWPGRMQKLQSNPAVWVDGATTTIAAESMIDSLKDRISDPVVAIIGTPLDRDFEGVYKTIAPHVQRIILTDSDINPNIRFPEPEAAVSVAKRFHDQVEFAPNLATALDIAKKAVGGDGTVLMALTLPLVGEAMLLYGLTFEVI